LKTYPFWISVLALSGAAIGTEIPNAIAATPVSPQPVSLVKEGLASSTICLAQNPSRSAALAAAEIQEHLQKITGAIIPIAYDSGTTPASYGNGARILIGESAGTRQLGIKPTALRRQEHLIRFLPNTIVLIGKDEEPAPVSDTPENKVGGTALLPLPELYAERGTLNAAYEFLERFCGVRWYLPGEVGTSFTSAKTVRVGGPEIRRTPNMKYREMASSLLYLQTEGATVPEREASLWKLRMRMGGERVAVGHSFEGYFQRFAKTHPDWFASQDESQSPQLCYSSPAVIQQVAQDARDYFDGKGTHPGAKGAGRFFSLVPMDTDLWCAADKPKFDKDEADNPQFSNGKVSPLIWDFVNNVAREVGKTNPKGYLAALSYWEYAYPPKGISLEPNISVQICLHTRNWWVPSIERNDRKILNSWVQREKGKRPLFLWLYYCFPGLGAKYGKYNEFPGFFAHTVVDQMKLYKEAGIEGIFMEHSSEMGRSILLDQLELYVTWKLADDPNLDGKKLIDEFFPRYYGSAAAPMQELYEGIEQVFTNPQSYPKEIRDTPGQQHQNEEIAWKYLGTAQRMKHWESLMVQARALATSPVEKERLALFEAGVWQPMKAGAERYRVTGPELDHAKAQKVPQISVPAIADAAGDASKVDWQRAVKVTQWSEVTGLPFKADIEMRLAHDENFIYAEFLDRRQEKALLTEPDIFSGDDWEIFFATQRERPYHQLAFNSAGTAKALRWEGPKEYSEWDSGAAIQSHTNEQGWSARLALPLSKLLPGGIEKNKPIYINAYRNTPGGAALAWSANFSSNFHDLERMVEVTLE
jgi:hypothetical protein